MNLMKTTFITILLILLAGHLLVARDWTNSDGVTIQGELVEVKGESVVLDVKGRIYTVPISDLSPEDQAYLDSLGHESEPEESVTPDELILDFKEFTLAGINLRDVIEKKSSFEEAEQKSNELNAAIMKIGKATYENPFPEYRIGADAVKSHNRVLIMLDARAYNVENPHTHLKDWTFVPEFSVNDSVDIIYKALSELSPRNFYGDRGPIALGNVWEFAKKQK